MLMNLKREREESVTDSILIVNGVSSLVEVVFIFINNIIGSPIYDIKSLYFFVCLNTRRYRYYEN